MTSTNLSQLVPVILVIRCYQLLSASKQEILFLFSSNSCRSWLHFLLLIGAETSNLDKANENEAIEVFIGSKVKRTVLIFFFYSWRFWKLFNWKNCIIIMNWFHTSSFQYTGCLEEMEADFKHKTQKTRVIQIPILW